MAQVTGEGTEDAGGEPVEEATPAGAGIEHVPTAVERAADPADLAVIREMFGSQAQTIINMLLSFDAYLDWYYAFKRSIPFMCNMELREARALDNMNKAIDMMEIFERASIRSHGSYLIHGAIYKTTRDILSVGDVRCVGRGPLTPRASERRD